MCEQPEEDFNDDFMFPMPNRLSVAVPPDADLDHARPADDLDISPVEKKRLVRSSSDPSINTADRVPGIPPYPAPPGYQTDRKVSVCVVCVCVCVCVCVWVSVCVCSVCVCVCSVCV